MTLVSPLSSHCRAIFRRLRITFSIISLIFSLLTIFVIISCRGQPSRKYTRLLLAMLILMLMSDVYVQLVVAPLYFYPVPCVVIWLTLFISAGPFFMGCFFYRHQKVIEIVMLPGSPWRCSVHVQKFPYILFVLIILFVP
ncbi:hypothetical protein PMAYCL1PPCAC_15511, partial [Pristionchus mayeri]